MTTAYKKRTGTLVSSAVLAAVCCGTIAAPAMADPPTDLDIYAEQYETTSGNNYLWDFIDGLHSFNSTGNIASYFGYDVEIMSGISGPGSYFVQFDWTDFDLGFGISYGYDQLLFILNTDVTPERDGDVGSIESVSVTTSVGGPNMANVINLLEVDGIITFEVDAQTVVDNSAVIVVEWSVKQIPAPGALALLGMAGFVGSRRRRRN